mgnify:CR=1 FL=1
MKVLMQSDTNNDVIELPNLIFDTLNEQGEKIDQTLKLQRETKEQFEPLKDHLHAVFALFRHQVRKQAASKGGAAHGVKKKIEITLELNPDDYSKEYLVEIKIVLN